MLTPYADVQLSDNQKYDLLEAKIELLVTNIHIHDPEKASIIRGLENYLITIKERRSSVTRYIGLNTTSKEKINAALQIAIFMENSVVTGELYSAIACKEAYNLSTYKTGWFFNYKASSGKLGEELGLPIRDYYQKIAEPKINKYFNAGMNLVILCGLAMLFVPDNLPYYKALAAGVLLGLSMVTCSLGLHFGFPEFAAMDNILAKNPQIETLLDNLAGVAQGSIAVVNRGLGRANRMMITANE